MADTRLAKIGITVKEPWAASISYEVLDYTLWRVQDGGDGCGYIALRDNIGVTPGSDDETWAKATQAGQSIYDLAVKYGHFEGTEAEFEQQYQQVLQAARDAASATNETNQQVTDAEALRVTAETGRVNAETARVDAEGQRASAEATRENNEVARGNAEAVRVSAESGRVEAESGRVSAESGRVSAENARELAETSRQQNTTAAIQDANTARDQADTAATRANTAAGVSEADHLVAVDDHTTATNDHTRAEEDHTLAGTDHTTAASDHTTAASDHTQAGTDHTTAASDHTTAGADHTLAASDHDTAGTDHTRAESDHTRAESDHQSIADKADVNGYYGGMTVGTAENLVGRGTVEAEYAGVRTSAGTADIGSGSAAIARMKGQSFVWNQQERNGDFSDGTTGWSKLTSYDTTMSVSNSSLVVTMEAIDDPLFRGVCNTSVSFIVGHKYLIEANVLSNEVSMFALVSGTSANYGINEELPIGSVAKIIQYRTSTNSELRFFRRLQDHQVETTLTIQKVQIFDLTLLFGAGNEPSTVEEFDAWRKEMGLTLDYYDYNPGEVINNKAAGILTRGFNLYNPSTGKAFLPGPYSDYPHEYEICGTFSSISFTDINGNTSVPTLTDGKFFNVDAPGELTVVGGNNTDTLVHLVWSGWRNEGEPDYAFEPYWENTLNLNLTQLTGKLNGAGESVVVFPNGLAKIGDVQDEIVGNKAIKRIGVVDLGTLDWYKNAYGFMRRSFPTISKNLLCPKYSTYNISDSTVGIQNADMVIGWNGGENTSGYFDKNSLIVRDSSLFDGTVAAFKTANSGVLLYYELETPEEYILDTTPDWNYRVDDFGTEQVLPSYSPINLTAPVSYDVQYAMNAVDTIRRLPDNYVERENVKQVAGRSERDVLSQKGVDNNYAKKVGVENDLVAGAAKALAGNQRQEKEFSTMVMDGANGIAKINEAMGKSLVWNQLQPNGLVEMTVTPPAAYSGGIQRNLNSDIIPGHKYLRKVEVKAGETVQAQYNFPVGSNNLYVNSLSNIYTTFSFLFTAVEIQQSNHARRCSFSLTDNAGAGIATYSKNDILFDLTQMFGAGNEPATVEEFEKLFPLPYYEYNAGEIISNKTQSLGITGFNQWDEEWELGTFNAQGEPVSGGNTRIRSKNYIPIFPETQYYRKSPGNGWHIYYDANKNFISAITSNQGFITPKNAYYLKFDVANTTTYNHDICINLSDPNRNGTYEPYKHANLPLNLSTITGKLNGEGESVTIFPDGLRSVGTVFDSLLVDEDGYARKAVKRMGSVDLGTLNWTYRSEYAAFHVRPNDSTYRNGNDWAYDCCTIGTVDYDKLQPLQSLNRETTGKCYWWRGGGFGVAMKNPGITDAVSFKNSVAGIMACYELETPETYDLDEPIPMTFMAYHGGTITQTPQAPDSAPMRMNVTFALDAVSTINGLPQNYISKESLQAMLAAMQSAGIFSGYTMTFNATTGKYEFTFTVSNS